MLGLDGAIKLDLAGLIHRFAAWPLSQCQQQCQLVNEGIRSIERRQQHRIIWRLRMNIPVIMQRDGLLIQLKLPFLQHEQILNAALKMRFHLIIIIRVEHPGVAH